jgi:hypothetical protein
VLLKLRRSQRMAGMMSKKAVFMLDARLDLTRAEAELVRKYQLDQCTVYDSAARSAAADNVQSHARASQSATSVGAAALSLGRAYLAALGAKLALRVTVGSLVRGQHIECKDLEELLGAESAIREAAQNVCSFLHAALTFDGREEVVEFPGLDEDSGPAPEPVVAQLPPPATATERVEPLFQWRPAGQ